MNSLSSPLISIIVPVYNTAPYLRQCLDSLCNQTYKNLEIICVNDGSTDDSATILSKYAEIDSRIVVITQKNSGPSVTRNVALDIAKGEWITGVDSDDWIEPDTYEYFVREIQHSDAKLAIYGVEEYNNSQKYVIRQETYPKGEFELTSEYIIRNITYWFWNKIWHRSLIEKHNQRFPEGLIYEDLVFFNCIAPYQEKILGLPDIKYHYMRYDNGSSLIDYAHDHNYKILDMMHVMEYVFEFYRKHPLPDNMRSHGEFLLQESYYYLQGTASPRMLQRGWELFKKLVDKYSLLDNPVTFPSLSHLYYISPEVKSYVTNEMNWQRRKLMLAIHYPRLLRRYRVVQFRAFFAWGKKRAKYEERRSFLKGLLREARSARREGWLSFF